jgi:anaerobic ribonucleoside-triphosphate reductase activating protein
VDGKFVEEQKDLSLMFRGSANQRILDVKLSLSQGQAVWLSGTWQRNMGSGSIYDV